MGVIEIEKNINQDIPFSVIPPNRAPNMANINQTRIFTSNLEYWVVIVVEYHHTAFKQSWKFGFKGYWASLSGITIIIFTKKKEDFRYKYIIAEYHKQENMSM